MITELEQEFYDTFGIEPEIDYDYKTVIQNVTKTGYWFDREYLIKMFNDNQKFKVIQVRKNISYPEITAEKLLEMICILNNYGKYDCWGVTIARLKKAILENCIVVVISKSLNNVILEQFKQQIQQLFKE